MEKLSISMVTLLVGKNASGKSRTLNVINALAGLVSGATKLAFKSGDYCASFRENDSLYQYELRYDDARVSKEKFVHLDHPAHDLLQPGRIGSRAGHFFGFVFFTAR